MEDFYIKCKSEEESELCEKWAIDNSLSSKNMAFEYTKEWCYFIVENNEYTLNDAETYNLPEKTLVDLGINTTTKKDWSKVSKEELLEEAKKRYPIGSKFKCLVTNSEYIIPKNTTFQTESSSSIFSYVNGILYHKHFNAESNKWAEIISTPEVKEITKYAGLKIGDKLPDNIICDWGEIGINKYFNGWIQQKGAFISDRYIKSFKELDGIVGFLVSGTDNVYLKADGFKEFMDSYSRPINTQSIKTTSEQYDLSTTITRAVKNNDPSIIARETGKSIDELCNLVDEKTTSCLTEGDNINCSGLKCSTDNCPFSQLSGKTKESAKAWLRSKSKQSLSDYEAVHVNSQEKWDFVSDKLGYTSRWVSSSKWGRYKKYSCINLKEVEFGTEGIAYSKVISFEDWVDLTGYRSEWDMFPKKPISMRYYMGTYPLTPVECVKEKPEFSLFPNFVSKIN